MAQRWDAEMPQISYRQELREQCRGRRADLHHLFKVPQDSVPYVTSKVAPLFIYFRFFETGVHCVALAILEPSL